eukprot:1997980-Rhodomonas_salina.1
MHHNGCDVHGVWSRAWVTHMHVTNVHAGVSNVDAGRGNVGVGRGNVHLSVRPHASGHVRAQSVPTRSLL